MIYVWYPKRFGKIDQTTIRLVDKESECCPASDPSRKRRGGIRQGIESSQTHFHFYNAGRLFL